jgi:Spy/CpxP family protein refolding chaperone
MIKLVRCALLCVFFAGSAWAQAPAPAAATGDELLAEFRAVQSQLSVGKREFVAQQLQLTPEQEAKFWPVFDAHQASLKALNERRLKNIGAYADLWNAPTTDEKQALALAKEALAIEREESALMERTFNKLKRHLPAVQLIRYLQFESKLRAFVRFELATQIPFVR